MGSCHSFILGKHIILVSVHGGSERYPRENWVRGGKCALDGMPVHLGVPCIEWPIQFLEETRGRGGRDSNPDPSKSALNSVTPDPGAVTCHATKKCLDKNKEFNIL